MKKIMVYQGIGFDDFVQTEGKTGFWTQVCKRHADRYKGNFAHRLDECPSECICGVCGCEYEADFYVDFHESEVTFLDEDPKITEGMIVRYAPEWCRPEERDIRLLVIESHVDTKQCLVQMLDSKLFLAPVEKVSFCMVEPTGETVYDDLTEEV